MITIVLSFHLLNPRGGGSKPLKTAERPQVGSNLNLKKTGDKKWNLMNVTMKSLSQLRHHQQICKVGVWWVEFVPVSIISIISGRSWTLVPHPETPVKPRKMARQSLTCNNKSREQPAQFPCWEIRIHFGVPLIKNAYRPPYNGLSF